MERIWSLGRPQLQENEELEPAEPLGEELPQVPVDDPQNSSRLTASFYIQSFIHPDII